MYTGKSLIVAFWYRIDYVRLVILVLTTMPFNPFQIERILHSSKLKRGVDDELNVVK